MRGTIVDDTVTVVLNDPVTILLAVFILITAGSLLYQTYKRKSIIIGEDYIIFKTRFREKKYTYDLISRISLSKERRIRVKKTVRVIKINFETRKLPVRIRPSAYLNDRELVQEIMRIKKNLKDAKLKN